MKYHLFELQVQINIFCRKLLVAAAVNFILGGAGMTRYNCWCKLDYRNFNLNNNNDHFLICVFKIQDMLAMTKSKSWFENLTN